MARDSADRLGFKVTAAVEAAELATTGPMSPDGALLGVVSLVGEPTVDMDN